ncbi:MAG: hypothetical protein ACERKO_10565 [Acetanaerobacterium sp.]
MKDDKEIIVEMVDVYGNPIDDIDLDDDTVDMLARIFKERIAAS